jgi:hypothetical protein
VVHLHTKIARAQHYIGSTNDLARRMQQHQRTWPLYQLTDDVYDGLLGSMPPSVLDKLRNMWGRRYRRKHTFLNAVHNCLGMNCFDLPLLKAARRHRSNGLLMTANQRSIAWCVSRCFLAAREFEFTLKRQHQIRPFCPVCQGSYVPF